ncbi:MAG: hypothetical protein CMP76_17280 [Flavobacterium sp.]|uniref:hypothetical protein n=1 Tax=Flavobacterium sp. TaxID=239 RepID=UPI000C43E94A|nr:hypothetical protein [Flavobacterium sp.]MBF05032.1 hypothetical protein [Flavobacterium sp.]|tara:strand:+ start:1048 stop:2307 length:1260 start_codon:yes stop_codon:yes gene_type:complete
MSIVYRSQKGSRLTSAEVDANFAQLDAEGNSILVQTGFSLVGQNLTCNPNWVWKILGTEYTNASSVVINFPYASSGNERIDALLLNTSNTFERLSGVESSDNPVSPPIPSGKIFVSYINVTDGVIGTPSDPLLGSAYVKKSFEGVYASALSGEDVELPFDVTGKSEIRLTNSSLVSVAGFTDQALTSSDEQPYPGKVYYIRNLTGVDVVLQNQSVSAAFTLYLNGGEDLVLPNNEVIAFTYDLAGMSERFKSWVSGGVSEGYNPNVYLIPDFYTHNWTQAGEPTFNLVHPANIGSARVRMEAPSLGSTYYIKFYFKEPVLISELYYCNGSAIINDGSIEQFKLFGSTSVKSENTFPLTLHDSTVGDAVMITSNHTTDFFEPYKKITLANPLTVASLRFEAHTIYSGGSTRPRIQKILFK